MHEYRVSEKKNVSPLACARNHGAHDDFSRDASVPKVFTCGCTRDIARKTRDRRSTAGISRRLARWRHRRNRICSRARISACLRTTLTGPLAIGAVAQAPIFYHTIRE